MLFSLSSRRLSAELHDGYGELHDGYGEPPDDYCTLHGGCHDAA